MSDKRKDPCRFYWGSHGCHLGAGHEGALHRCGGLDWNGDPDTTEVPCSEFDEATGLVRHASADRPEWFDWTDCCRADDARGEVRR